MIERLQVWGPESIADAGGGGGFRERVRMLDNACHVSGYGMLSSKPGTKEENQVSSDSAPAHPCHNPLLTSQCLFVQMQKQSMEAK